MNDPTSAVVVPEIEHIREALRRFAAERDWDRFHTPKNLAAALSVEAAELLEHLQWLTAEESANLSEVTLSKVRLEMADVLLYLIRLADKLNVDLMSAATEEIRINAAKYPADQVRGDARKYSEY